MIQVKTFVWPPSLLHIVHKRRSMIGIKLLETNRGMATDVTSISQSTFVPYYNKIIQILVTISTYCLFLILTHTLFSIPFNNIIVVVENLCIVLCKQRSSRRDRQ